MKNNHAVIFVILGIFCLGLFWVFSNQGTRVYALQGQQFTGNEEHQVDLVSALHYIKNHQDNLKLASVKGGFFGRNAIEKILSQQGCVGIRYYYARNDERIPVLVLVGVDSKGLDMQTGFIAEVARPCPPYCDENSELSR